jgi:hypothetical protein
MSYPSEPLREQQGEHQVDPSCDSENQSDEVVGGHSRSTPFAINANTAKMATVRRMNTRSVMADSVIPGRAEDNDHDESLTRK